MPDDAAGKRIGSDGSTTGQGQSQGPDATAASTATRAEPASHRRSGSMALLIPALTFVIGLLLGAAVMWAGSDWDDDDDAAAGPTPTQTQTTGVPTTSSTARPDATVTVPGACLDVAESAEAVADLMDDAVDAAQELDAAELSSIVREMDASRAEIESQTSACQAGAGSP